MKNMLHYSEFQVSHRHAIEVKRKNPSIKIKLMGFLPILIDYYFENPNSIWVYP